MDNGKCKYCGAELLSTSKICPKCQKYQDKRSERYVPLYIIIGIVIVLFIVGNYNSRNIDNSGNVSTTVKQTITYEKCNIKGMKSELDENALKAERKYNDKYIEITGYLDVIDSDGKYISVKYDKDEILSADIQCYIKSEDQINKILEMKTGDKITIKGKISSVGEIIGYSMDIDSIE